MTSTRFLLVVLGVGFALLTACAVTTFVIDPYWIYSERTSWSSNRILDVKMRFAKSVQLIERGPNLLFVGSSTVYRGIDPLDVTQPGIISYNLGISSLRMTEAVEYLRRAIKLAPVRHVVLGLDYFMFNGLKQTEQGFDERLADWSGIVESIGTAVFSWSALHDARSVAMARDYVDRDGIWYRNGYKMTYPRSAKAIEAQLESARRSYREVDCSLSQPYRALEALLDELVEQHIRVQLYLSPVHDRYREVWRESGRLVDVKQWQARIREIARRHKVELWDMSMNNPYLAIPFDNTDSMFLDPSHFDPKMGRLILARLGLAEIPTPASIGSSESRVLIGQRID